jgi:hypothetical protein
MRIKKALSLWILGTAIPAFAAGAVPRAVAQT